MKINELSNYSLQVNSPRKETTLHRLINRFETGSSDGIKNEFARLDPTALGQVLENLIREIAQLDSPDLWIEKLSGLIPLEKLEEAVRSRFSEHVSASETAKALLEDARHFFQTVDGRPTYSWRAQIEAFFDSCISILETFLNAFGLADFFRLSESYLENDIKSNRIMQLLMLFSTVSTILLPVLGPTLATSIVGGTLLGTTSLSLLFPTIRPAPTQLPKAMNWTKQYRQGALYTSPCRKESLDAIASALSSTDRIKTHPMLIGKSGAGKTETIKAFVAAIERGDYPALQGKQVFYFNTANLVKGAEALSGENKIFANINRAMGSHRDNIILVFDEIQLACQKETKAIGEQLKTLLDPGNGSFAHVIGITTEEEYYRDIYLNNAAFARRFKRINIESPTAAETLEILTNTALQLAPEILIEEGALQELLKKTRAAYPEAPEPITSLKILTKCLQKASDTQKSPLERQAEEIRSSISSLHAQSASFQGSALLPYTRLEEITKLEGELEKIERRQESAMLDLKRFFRKREELLASKKRVFQIVLGGKKDLAEFLLRTHFLLPLQTNNVIREATRLGIKTVLDAFLIQTVLEEELENDRKVAEAVERGRSQIQARANS